MLEQITPLVITRNEAANLRRILRKLTWAPRIVVIDSGSTDETIEIAKSFPQVEVVQNPFADFAAQCNFGLTQIRSPWVLSLDADYELSDALVAELGHFSPGEQVSGYRVKFVYRVLGRPLRGTLYPPRVVLYRRECANYRSEGHGHRVSITGEVVNLNGVIYHDDRKPISRFIASQQRYAKDEAIYLLEACHGELSRTDRLRRMGWPAPLLVLFYVLFVKGCILDGWAGWHYALQRLAAETLIALEVVDRKL